MDKISLQESFEEHKDRYIEEWKELVNSGEGSEASKITPENIEIVLNIAKMNKTELEKACEELELPKEGWENKEKKDLVVHLAVTTINA